MFAYSQSGELAKGGHSAPSSHSCSPVAEQVASSFQDLVEELGVPGMNFCPPQLLLCRGEDTVAISA